MDSPSTRPGRAIPTALLSLLLAVGPPLLAARPAHAATTFVVTSIGDNPDADPGDGVCDTTPGGPSAPCSLRAAIQEANAVPGADSIHFAIPGDGVHTIRPTSPLPPLEGRTTVDGYTQPGAKPNTLTRGTNAALRIELDGSRSSPGHGLTVRGANSLIRGLAIRGYGGGSVFVDGADAIGARVAGCFLGTDATATARQENFHGVLVVDAVTTLVGGSTPAARNLIAGNRGVGVYLLRATAAMVQGNLIGTDPSGRAALPNGLQGVFVDDSANATIGGALDGTSNTIAFNGHAGVGVFGTSSGTEVVRSSIFANAGIGIDLGNDGATPNDANDTDAGPNALQNKPLVDTAATAGASTVVQGRLNSVANRTYVIRVYSSPTGDEGKLFRGQTTATTDGAGRGAWELAPSTAIPEGHRVTATATDPDGNTSEFSLAKVVG